MSWDETFAEHYDEWSAGMAADVAFYVELARAANGPMLEQARHRAAAAQVDLDLREGDMGDLALDEPAGLIYCPFRALLHVPTWARRP